MKPSIGVYKLGLYQGHKTKKRISIAEVDFFFQFSEQSGASLGSSEISGQHQQPQVKSKGKSSLESTDHGMAEI
jgi:hypothetical protein